MEELFLPKTHSIFTFKKGDIIIRVAPNETKKEVYNENLMIKIEVDTLIDNSFRSTMQFLRIANGLIYLEYADSYEKGRKTNCYLEKWKDGWAYYEKPNFK